MFLTTLQSPWTFPGLSTIHRNKFHSRPVKTPDVIDLPCLFNLQKYCTVPVL